MGCLDKGRLIRFLKASIAFGSAIWQRIVRHLSDHCIKKIFYIRIIIVFVPYCAQKERLRIDHRGGVQSFRLDIVGKQGDIAVGAEHKENAFNIVVLKGNVRDASGFYRYLRHGVDKRGAHTLFELYERLIDEISEMYGVGSGKTV